MNPNRRLWALVAFMLAVIVYLSWIVIRLSNLVDRQAETVIDQGKLIVMHERYTALLKEEIDMLKVRNRDLAGWGK